MLEYEKVDLAFLDTAPIRLVMMAEFEVPPEQLFEWFERTDTWGWATIERVTWETEPPHHVGTTRTVHVASQGDVLEYFLLWDQGRRMAFRFERGEMATVSALVEDYLVEPLDGDRCRLNWTVGMQLRGLWRVATPLLRGVMRRQFQGMLDDFVRFAADQL